MKVYQTNEIKNIALLGSSGSGKTTLVEAMLFESGVIKRRGTIAAKNTVSDYFPVEQEYGYSVFSTVFHVEWNNKKLNMIDCPGSDDFVGGTVTALNVTDTAILLLNGQYGVEVGTQNHFRYTEKLNKPVIFLVNQLDNDKCDYDNILEQLKEAYGSKVVPIQYPINTGPEFNSLIDVLLMKKYSWKPEGGAPIIEDIPAEEMDKAMEWHKALVEAAAENDEELMEKFFEQDSLTEDEMREGIRKGLASRGMFPVFCVCAGKDMGVRRLMEFLGNVVQTAHTHILARTYAEYGEHAAGSQSFADALAHLVFGQRILFEEFLHQGFIVFGSGLHQCFMHGSCFLHLLSGNIFDCGCSAFRSPRIFFHQKYINQRIEIRSGSQRVLNGNHF